MAFQKPACSLWPRFPNVTIVRGDLIHPIVSGNKLYKVEPLIENALSQGADTLISVGGRYSNHLHALAWLASQKHLQTIGLVRGYAEQAWTETLKDCQRWGMVLHFVSHGEYQHRYTDEFWQPWLKQYPNSFRIDEGGWSATAIAGAHRWWSSIPKDATMVLCAVGSGSTYAGLLKSAPAGIKVVGIPAFLDSDGYQGLIAKLVESGLSKNDITLWTDFVEKGFGKLSPAQMQFKVLFEQETDITLDPVYNSKVLYTLFQHLKIHSELSGERIAVIHSGGLQGNRS